MLGRKSGGSVARCPRGVPDDTTEGQGLTWAMAPEGGGLAGGPWAGCKIEAGVRGSASGRDEAGLSGCVADIQSGTTGGAPVSVPAGGSAGEELGE